MDRETWQMLITTAGTLGGLIIGGAIGIIALWTMRGRDG